MDIMNVPCSYIGGYRLNSLSVGNQYYSFSDIAREGFGSVSGFIEIPAGVRKFHFKPVKRQTYYFQYERDSEGHIIYNPDGTPAGQYSLSSEASLCFNRINYFRYLGENSGYKYLGYDSGSDTENTITLERQAQSYRWQATHVVFSCSVKYTQIPVNWIGESSVTVIQAPNFNTVHEPWLIGENDELYSEPIPETRENSIIKPIPKALWRVDGNLLWHELLGFEISGAFMNCTLLTGVHIPESVKLIGNHAFENTALKAVKIASDCEYSETSFPENCEITFYDTHKYSQLYGADGKAVIDCYGRRIYVRSD